MFFLFIFINYLQGIVTRRPLVLQLHKTDDGQQDYAEFLHAPRKRYTDFGNKVSQNISFNISVMISFRHQVANANFLVFD